MRAWATSMALSAMLLASGSAAMGDEERRPVDRPVAQADVLPLLGVEVLLPQLARARPFDRVLGLALLSARDDPGLVEPLQQLRPVAARGAPTLRMLAADMPATADRAIAIEAGLDRGGIFGRWAATTMRYGAGLSVGATPVLTATTEAMARLGEDDLAGAVALLAEVEGRAGEAFGSWLAAARDRMLVDAIAARLADLVALRAAGAP